MHKHTFVSASMRACCVQSHNTRYCWSRERNSTSNDLIHASATTTFCEINTCIAVAAMAFPKGTSTSGQQPLHQTWDFPWPGVEAGTIHLNAPLGPGPLIATQTLGASTSGNPLVKLERPSTPGPNDWLQMVKGSCDIETAVAWAKESKMLFIEQQRRRRQETAQPLCLPQTQEELQELLDAVRAEAVQDHQFSLSASPVASLSASPVADGAGSVPSQNLPPSSAELQGQQRLLCTTAKSPSPVSVFPVVAEQCAPCGSTLIPTVRRTPILVPPRPPPVPEAQPLPAADVAAQSHAAAAGSLLSAKSETEEPSAAKWAQ